MPSFSESPYIYIFRIIINFQKQKITRYYKKYRNSTTTKNNREESANIFIYCHSRKANCMQLRHIHVRMINMYENYQNSQRKPQHSDSLRKSATSHPIF